MERILTYIQAFLSVAISASMLHHFSRLSPTTNHASVIIILICCLLWLGAFVSDDRICKWLHINLETFRFVMTAIAAAVFVGLIVPTLPGLIDWMGSF